MGPWKDVLSFITKYHPTYHPTYIKQLLPYTLKYMALLTFGGWGMNLQDKSF